MAQEAGFDLVGLTPLTRPPHASHFETWLTAGRHGTMEYLERNRERIVEPPLVAPGGKTLLMLGLGHSRPEMERPDGAKIARYALGRDYHNLMGKRLRSLAKRLVAEGLAGAALARVDAVPLLERSHAEAAGLGYSSKACNLLHPQFGPWFFLGELILDVELAPTPAGPNISCGTCTACIDACPTGALVGPGELDARKCISYQTIEHRGAIPHGMREGIDSWLFGCDICSQVCPWGHKAPNLSDRFGTHQGLERHDLLSLVDPGLAGEQLDEDLLGSPMRRAKPEGLARNAAIVLGNRPVDGGREALLKTLEEHPSAFVREAAAWSLAHGYGADQGVRPALDRALEREQGPIKGWIEQSLDRS
ncbi:MAG: tRNA epoxyqueuosine(34) reductase QueG [Planctomycetes bacterium]|nr:tRNA epoxyqueuosine(34) reductase QueG [Planctomycetota bacterium]